jgi:uncharacterized protein
MKNIMVCAAMAIAAIAGGCASQTAGAVDTAAAVPVAPKPVTPAGDWYGTVSRPPGVTFRLGFHVEETAPGTFAGSVESPDMGAPKTPLAGVTFADNILSFSLPASRSSFKGTWDAAAGAWVGDYSYPAGASQLKLVSGVMPPTPPLPAVAGLDGRWEGRVQAALPVVLRVKTEASGTIARLDLPGQATGIPLATLVRDGARVKFSITGYAMSYEGALSADGSSITGAVSQLGQALPLVFTHTSSDFSPAVLSQRPQTPRKPYPYKEEEVVFDNPAAPGVKLACSFTSPNSPGPHPAAVLISGSGPHDRDATVLGHKTFLVLADHLTRKGVAVLRCDDRGVGKSTGDFTKTTLDDFASDAEAGFAFLRTHPSIDPKRIGLIGHSLGTIIGPNAAAKQPDAAFLVMLAAAGVPGREISIDQQQAIARADGMPDKFLASSGALWRKVVAIVNSPADNASVRSSVLALLLAEGPSAYPTGMTEATAKAEADRVSSDYVRGVQAYDPAKFLSTARMPILAMNGALDVQATPALNLGGLRKILAKHSDATVLEMPGLNHAFQHAKTGAMSEYAEIEETFAPEALEMISSWIVKRMIANGG